MGSAQQPELSCIKSRLPPIWAVFLCPIFRREGGGVLVGEGG